jgi:hypothetical protein
MTFIDLSKRRRRWKVTAGPGGTPVGVRILGFEATQAIQNMAHGVRLIAGKPVVVRVYLEPPSLSTNLRVRGEIVVAARPGAPGAYIASSNEVTLRAVQHPGLAEQRRNADLSLNFLVKKTQVGAMAVMLKRLSAVSGGEDFPILPEGNDLQVTLSAAPVLRVRALGIRYIDGKTEPPEQNAPDAAQFNHLRSYLRRVFPVSAIEWSQAVIAAPKNFVPPFLGPKLPDGFDPLWDALRKILHRYMLIIRQADMNSGWDPRTHYYGLVSDKSGFFRGAANDVPAAPAPHTVAAGPCGVPPKGHWDNDLSYGDWYGAHELAHTFGRKHPGFCDMQSKDDPLYPHSDGAISDAAEDCVGFDTGDPTLSIPMRAYPPEHWCDFMTYCDQQWISKYTYDGIYERLMLEDKQFSPQQG